MASFLHSTLHTIIFLSIYVTARKDKPKLPERPNIFFLLIDDMGWSDLSLHGGCDYKTPVLDEIAREGVELTSYYTQHLCTPTRHALMSGRYPISDGMQEHVIGMTMPYGMPLGLTTLPQMMQRAGYRTHMLGKWHLGFFRSEYTPTRRGFDAHIGFWGEAESYFEKNKTDVNVTGLDFRRNMEPFANWDYSTYIYRDEAIEIMRSHVADVANGVEDTEPFFIYFSSQAAHPPFEAPAEIIEQVSEYIEDPLRQVLTAAMIVLDEAVGHIVDYMKSAESNYLWENTLFIVSSDNGGDTTMGMSNFPLRGSKATLWEGGIRSTAYVTGGLVPEERIGTQMDALMHVTDWFPTLCHVAMLDIVQEDIQNLDGYDQLENIWYGESSKYEPREVILHNIIPADYENRMGISGAIRWKQWKLIIGKEADKSGNDCQSSWCAASDVAELERLDDDTMTIQCSNNTNTSNYDYPDFDPKLMCPFHKSGGNPCLFNIEDDPCEWVDLRQEEKAVYTLLWSKLVKYNTTQVLPTLYSQHSNDWSGADPVNFNGWWSPWMDGVDEEFFNNDTSTTDDVDHNTTDESDSASVDDEEELFDSETSILNAENWLSQVPVTTAMTLGVVVLMCAALLINMLYDLWRDRWSYKDIDEAVV